jgi:hypothetical protein
MSPHHTSSSDSRAFDAARAADMLLNQYATDVTDPYTVCDPLFPSIIHDLLLLATFLGEDPGRVIAESMDWFKKTMDERWDSDLDAEEGDLHEARRSWSAETLSQMHRLYHDGHDEVHLMGCFGRLANGSITGAQGQNDQ